MLLETNNPAAANMAEHFLMSSFLSSSVVLQSNVGRRQVFRAFSLPRRDLDGPSSL